MGARRVIVVVVAAILGLVGASVQAAEPAMRFRVSDARVVEGDGPGTSLVFIITQSRPQPVARAVPWSTAAGSATAPEDFAAASGTAVFPPGVTAVDVAVGVVGDRVDESDETMELRLGNPPTGRVEDGSGTGTIVDDDTDRRLVVEVAGEGTVDSSPGGIEACGSGAGSCAATYQEGTEVTLDPSPGAEQRVGSWGGACAGTPATSPCAVTLDEDATATVAFEPDVHELSISLQGASLPEGRVMSEPAGMDCGYAGSGTGLSCAAPFPAGTEVTLTQEPSGARDFGGWGGDCTGTGPCTVVMDQPRHVSATWLARPTVVVSFEGTGRVTGAGGAIDCWANDGVVQGGPCDADGDLGSTMELVAEPRGDAVFVSWGGACAAAGASSTCQLTLDERTTYDAIARFTRPPATLTVARQPLYGGVFSDDGDGLRCGPEFAATDCALSAPRGSVIELEARPQDFGSGLFTTFEGWAGACQGDELRCVVVLEQDTTVCAVFSGFWGPDTVCLEIPAASGFGGVTSQPEGLRCGAFDGAAIGEPDVCVLGLPTGTAVRLDATATDGYYGWDGSYLVTAFDHWTGACAGQSATCELPSQVMAGIVRTCALFHVAWDFGPGTSGSKLDPWACVEAEEAS